MASSNRTFSSSIKNALLYSPEPHHLVAPWLTQPFFYLPTSIKWVVGTGTILVTRHILYQNVNFFEITNINVNRADSGTSGYNNSPSQSLLSIFFALVLFYGVKQKVYLALFRFQSCCFYNAGLQPFPCFTVINTNYLHQLTWFVLLVFFQSNFYIRKFGIYSIDSPLRCFCKRHNDTTFQGNYNHKVTPNIAQVWLGHYSVTAWYINLLLQFFLFLYILKLAFRILPQKHIFCKIK